MPVPHQATLQIRRSIPAMMKHDHTGEFEIIDDHPAGKIVVNLTGGLNNGGKISTKFDALPKDLENLAEESAPSLSVWLRCTDNLSWTMKKQDENTQEGKYWGSFSRDVKANI